MWEKRKEERVGVNGERVERCLAWAMNLRNLRVEEALELKVFMILEAEFRGFEAAKWKENNKNPKPRSRPQFVAAEARCGVALPEEGRRREVLRNRSCANAHAVLVDSEPEGVRRPIRPVVFIYAQHQQELGLG